MSISIKVTNHIHIDVPMFTGTQMHHFAEVAIARMKERVASGLDVEDSTEPPLSERYARQKQAEGGSGIRDLYRSGQMMNSLEVLDSTPQSAHVGLSGQEAYRKGIFNENVDPWFGVSDANNSQLMEEDIEPAFAQNILESQL